MKRIIALIVIILAVLLLEEAISFIGEKGFGYGIQLLLRLTVWLPLMFWTTRLFYPNKAPKAESVRLESKNL